MGKAFDYLIVGAGIVGTSIAYHLAMAGQTSVAVIDRGRTSALPGSTGHAPGLLMRNSPNTTMSQLASYTASLYEDLPSGSCMTRVGSVEATCNPDRADEFALKLEIADRLGLTATALDHEDLKNLYPYITPEPVEHAVHIEGDGVVNAVNAVKNMRAYCEATGHDFFEETLVTGFEATSGHVNTVITDKGPISGDQVVLACGFWGAHLAGLLGEQLSLTPVAHPLVWTKDAVELETMGNTEIKRPIFRDVDNLFYLRERFSHFGLGWYKHRAEVPDVAGVEHGQVPFPTSGFYETLDYKLFPFLDATPPEYEINGIFSMTPDNGPLMGPSAQFENLYFALAVWVTASGGVGRAVAEMLMEKRPFVDATKLSHLRFSSLSPEEARAASLALYDRLYTWPLRSQVTT